MKKLLVLLSTVLALSAFAQPQTITHKTQSFLGGQNLVVSNNFTVSYGTVGSWFVPVGQATNLLSLVANPNNTNVYVGPAIVDVNGVADATGAPSDNSCISIVANSTNLVLDTYQGVLMTNLYGANWVYAAVVGNDTTNALTFTFVKSVDGVNFDARANGGGLWTFSFPGVPTSGSTYVYTTNVPTWFMTGARRIRLYSVAGHASAAKPINLNSVTLGSWSP